jgi:peptidoglycan/LPS O-acetylase OafA/YrhL
MTLFAQTAGLQPRVAAASRASLPAHAAFRAASYFATLDVLRAIAILAVVWHHTGGLAYPGHLSHQGYHGVTLFFAISGFLIVTLLLREKSATGDISIRGFMIKRALRILPLYYATLAIYVVMVALLERDAGAKAQFFANLPAFATFTTNWFVSADAPRIIFVFAWSLAAEEQFYLIWPWIERARFGRMFGLGVACAAVALSPSFAGALWSTGEPQPFVLQALSRLPAAIGLGVILAHLLHDHATFRFLASLLGRRGSGLLIATLLAFALTGAIDLGRAEPAAVALLSMALVGACVIRPDNDLARLARLPGVVHIGVVSYGLYLLHMLSANGVKMLGASFGFNTGLLWFVGTLAVALALASLSHATFERWCLSLRQHLLPTTIPAARS